MTTDKIRLMGALGGFLILLGMSIAFLVFPPKNVLPTPTVSVQLTATPIIQQTAAPEVQRVARMIADFSKAPIVPENVRVEEGPTYSVYFQNAVVYVAFTPFAVNRIKRFSNQGCWFPDGGGTLCANSDPIDWDNPPKFSCEASDTTPALDKDNIPWCVYGNLGSGYRYWGKV